MTLLYHLAFLGRSCRQIGDGPIEYLDGKPAPTRAELDATHADALAEWNRQQQIETFPLRRSEMAALFDALPIEQQAALFSTRVAVEQALDRGRPDIARQMVVAAAIPAELEPVRAAILEKFSSLP